MSRCPLWYITALLLLAFMSFLHFSLVGLGSVYVGYCDVGKVLHSRSQLVLELASLTMRSLMNSDLYIRKELFAMSCCQLARTRFK